jgi:hypothetical protein
MNILNVIFPKNVVLGAALSALGCVSALATPTYTNPYPGPFPNVTQDGQAFSSLAIGAKPSGPGVYLWFLEDIMLSDKPDRDYNDGYGLLTILDDKGNYLVETFGGLGYYYSRGMLGFSGTEFDSAGNIVFLWNSPSGTLRSGTQQVALFKLTPDGTANPVPEPGSMVLGLLGLLGIAARKLNRF